MGQIQSHRGILQILCVYNSDKGVMHNEVERLQTSLYDKAGVTPYCMAEDKESVFIGTLFYFAQNKHTVFMQFSQIEKIR